MRRFLPLLLAGSLWACSDSKTSHDAGDDHDAGDHQHEDGGHSHDAGDPEADAGTGSGLDQPESKLERPPGEKLPDALKPPGYTH